MSSRLCKRFSGLASHFRESVFGEDGEAVERLAPARLVKARNGLEKMNGFILSVLIGHGPLGLCGSDPVCRGFRTGDDCQSALRQRAFRA